MNIAILGAGAAGMYCGSCLRDNALAVALKRAGHHVVLVPLYTPMKTDEPSVAIRRVFYGGVNAWLQYASGIFRRTPRFVDWIFDRGWLLKWAGQYGAQSDPAKLAGFTRGILAGDHGPTVKELMRLVTFLKHDEKRPEVVTLPNAMFVGLAGLLKRELGCRVVCELTGEDIFLDAMREQDWEEMREIIRDRARDVDLFVATSSYYAEKMRPYLGVERVEVVISGVPAGQLAAEPTERPAGRAPTIGYFARICPEKGADRALEIFSRLRSLRGMEHVRLRIAGYLGRRDHDWWAGIWKRAQRSGLADAIDFVGEVDLPGKLAFYDSIDVLCVPTAYAEAKGMYVLEALGRGVPAVKPAHGSFVELAELTGGIDLFRPDDLDAAAEKLAAMLSDETRRREMGRRGWSMVCEKLTDAGMAEAFVRLVSGRQQPQLNADQRG